LSTRVSLPIDWSSAEKSVEENKLGRVPPRSFNGYERLQIPIQIREHD
jgi:hypothetical protein